jgi:MFS family permease
VLSVTITSFLIALTYIENGALSEDSFIIVAASFAVSAASLAAFVFIEKRVKEPLVNLRLLRHKVLLPSYLIMTVIGTTMFLVCPSIVQLVRSPPPSGFGGDALDAANVQLPFMVMFLVFSNISALVIARLGKVNPTVFGGIISIIGGVGLLMSHSTTLLVAANLTVIAVGLAMTATATWNLVVSSAPMEFMGISTGIGALLLSIGMSVGPALAGTYMQDHITIEGLQFPSPASFDMIFLTTGLLAAAWLFFALVLKKRLPRSPEQTMQ